MCYTRIEKGYGDLFSITIFKNNIGVITIYLTTWSAVSDFIETNYVKRFSSLLEDIKDSLHDNYEILLTNEDCSFLKKGE